MRYVLAALGVILMWVGGCLAVSAQSPTADAAARRHQARSVDFSRDIRPILEANCFECHGPKKSRGRLRLDVKASAFKGGNTGPGRHRHTTATRA